MRGAGEGLGEFLRQDAPRTLLVRRANEAVEETHCHGLRSGVTQTTHCRAERRLIQRRFHRAVVTHALGHFQAEIARHQRRGLVSLQVVQVGALLPADLQQVAETLGGYQPGLRATMLDQRVGRHGGAVAEVSDRAWPDADLPDTLRHTLCDTERRIIRRGRHLPHLDPAGVLVEQADVGEGAA